MSNGPRQRQSPVNAKCSGGCNTLLYSHQEPDPLQLTHLVSLTSGGLALEASDEIYEVTYALMKTKCWLEKNIAWDNSAN